VLFRQAAVEGEAEKTGAKNGKRHRDCESQQTHRASPPPELFFPADSSSTRKNRRMIKIKTAQ
jgi:hypothetical protein